MDVLTRTKTEYNFINVEAKIKRVDLNSTDIYFINAVNARQVFNILKYSVSFDGCNDVYVKNTHTISVSGEVDIRYNKNIRVLTIVSFI